MTSTTSDKPSSKGLGGRLSRLAAPLLIAVAIQSAANLIFHAVVGRSLPAADYGALGAVLSAMTLVAVPLSALQTAAAGRPPPAASPGRLPGGRSIESRSIHFRPWRCCCCSPARSAAIYRSRRCSTPRSSPPP